MRINPFLDAFRFLTQPRWTTAVFWLLLIVSALVAYDNGRRDPSQRSAVHVGTWLARFSIGAMWWGQTLWKVPPDFGGLRFWVGEIAKFAAFPWHQDFIRNIVLPHFSLFAPQVYLAEVLVAVSLILGLFSRLGAFVGLLMAVNLWLGLYRDPPEWPWTYGFLIIVQFLFLMYRPGRSLGLDAILLRRQTDTRAPAGRARLLRLLS